MRKPEMELQEYSTSFHLEKMYSTVPSSQPITVRAVTVFQSHEVFTCTAQPVCAIPPLVSLAGSANSALLHSASTFLTAHSARYQKCKLQHLTGACFNKVNFK